MSKIHAFLIAFSLLAAGLLGFGVASQINPQAPAIVAARAAQEQAKADLLQAKADTEKIAAERARAFYQAIVDALPEITAGIRWAALGTGIAIGFLSCGLAYAVVTWALNRARAVYPNSSGQWPMLTRRVQEKGKPGKWIITDPSRLLGPVAVVGDDGVVDYPLPASEASALQLATQSQASGVMVGVSRRAAGTDVAERVRQAAKMIPAPTFENAGNGAPHFVYVTDARRARAQRTLQDLEEFIQFGWTTRGLARSAWVGQGLKFRSGNDVTRKYYDSLCERLEKARVAENTGDGWQPVVELSEALQAFGLETKTQEEVSE